MQTVSSCPCCACVRARCGRWRCSCACGNREPFPLPNFGLKSHLHSVQYLFLAYLQGNIAICPTHAQMSIFGEKSFARQISEENPIVSQLVIIAAMPPFCQARIRTSEPVFILFCNILSSFYSSHHAAFLNPFRSAAFASRLA